MPVYTYQCENCGIRFDRYQKFTDQPLAWCPECAKKTLRKVYSPVGIVFKGSGFYATDNRSPSGVNYGSSKNTEKSADTDKAGGDGSSSSTTSPSTSAPASSSSPATSAKDSKE